jgi:hypothetical protein
MPTKNLGKLERLFIIMLFVLALSVGIYEYRHSGEANAQDVSPMTEYTGQLILKQLDRIETKIDNLVLKRRNE